VRIVLDTVVVVSAARAKTGASAELLRRALNRDFDLLLSAPLVLEYEAVLKRAQHLEASDYGLDDVDTLLLRLCEVSIKVSLGHFRRPATSDSGDEHVLNLAWRGRADLLVTHNHPHFQPGAMELGVKCYSPRDALSHLEALNATNAPSQ
jgi:putative PIN family toxin of toxin-antitoxin system